MSSEPVCEVSKKLLDLEQRSVVEFLTKEGKKPKEILERMVEVYGDKLLNAPRMCQAVFKIRYKDQNWDL